MFRRAWWRGIPSELLIPAVGAAVLEAASLLVPAEYGGLALPSRTAVACNILVLCGLLELRHRLSAGASRWVVLGAALLGADAVLWLLLPFAPLVLDREVLPGVFRVGSAASLALAVLFAVAMIAAARAWRSWAAPVALVASCVCRVPSLLAAELLSSLELVAAQACFALAPALAQLALLAVYRRFGTAAPAPAADAGRAERGARRAAAWLRARAALVVLAAVAGGVLAITAPPSWQVAPAVLLGFGLFATVLGEVSGLLAMSRARVVDLPGGELRVAAFGVMWGGPVSLGAGYSAISARGPVPTTLMLIAWLVAVAIAGNAMRALARKRGDARLDHTITSRVILVGGIQLLSIVTLWVANQPGDLVMLVLAYPVLQAVAVLVLASVYTRVAQGLQTAAAVDVF